ncbi:unnamed protein product, partial [marine sediment metagenome]
MQAIERFDRWGIPVNEAALYRRAVLGQKAQPLNFKVHSETVGFSISPYGEPNGKTASIKVEDVARGLEFNWADGIWDSTPTVTVGSKTLIVGAVFTNMGNVSGTFNMTMIDDAGAVLGSRSATLNPG